MSVLAIVRPMLLTATSTGFVNPTYAVNPDPKDAAYLPSGSTSGAKLTLDMGSVQNIDTIFVGYVSDTPSGVMRIAGSADGSNTVFTQDVSGAPSDAAGDGPQHFLLSLPAPQAVRYVTLSSPTSFAAGYTIGAVGIGLAFRPMFGMEYGSGRPITDLSSITRLQGGGFSVDEGARVGGFSWSLGELTDAEVRSLYLLVRNRGNSRTLLMVEDPDVTTGLNERIHWGLLAKFDAYERFALGATRWALRIDDWA